MLGYDARTACVALAAFALAACGGGGSGGSAETQHILSVDHQSVTVTSSLSDALTADQHIAVNLHDPPAAAQYLIADYTTNGLWAVDTQFTPNGTGAVTLHMRAQSGLKPGTYNDTLRVRLCDSHDCSGRVFDTLTNIPVVYTVTDYRQAPVVTFDPASIALQGLSIDFNAQASAEVHVTVQNLAYYPYIVASANGTVASIVNSYRKDDSSGRLTVNFNSPHAVGPGNAADRIIIVGCLDSTCVNQLPGSPFNIDVAETVGPALSVGGPAGYTLTAMGLSTFSIAADPVHRVVYATDKNSDSLTRPTAEAIDPVTATIGATSQALSPWPGRVSAVSADGQFLYVAMIDDTVARFLLPALTLDARFALHASGEETTDATDIVPKPGAPKTIAVAFTGVTTTRTEPSAAIFDDTVRRPQVAVSGIPYWFSGTPIQGVAWDPNAPLLYGTGLSGSDSWSAFSLSSNSSGIAVSGTLGTWSASAFANNRLRIANGHLYHDSGELIDLQQGTSRVLTTDQKILAVIPDGAHNKLFVIGEDPSPVGEGPPTVTMIHSLNLQTMAAISDVLLPGIVSGVLDAQRYGEDGIVLRMQDQLVFMSGAFVTN